MNFSEILKRRTVRKFKQTPIAEKDLRALVNAARLASSAANRLRLRYIVARTPEIAKKIFPLTAYAGLVKPKRDPVPGKTAPTAFIAVVGSTGPDDHLFADAGAAIQSIEFAAWELGIGCCWLGSFKKEETAEILGTEPDKLLYLVALGYADEKPVLEDIPADGSAKYYLDTDDVLHVPKFTVDVVSKWI